MMRVKQLWMDALTGGMLGILTICLFVLLYISKNGVTAVDESLLVLLVVIPAGAVFYIALKALLDIE